MALQTATLDNPVWHALTNQQATIALGDERARRYPHDIAPFAAVVSNEEAALRCLADLMSSDEALLLVGSHFESSELEVLHQFPLTQMVYEGPTIVSEQSDTIKLLADVDVPAILELIAVAQPGPFLPRTIELGRYLSIWQDRELASMAGVRMHLPGFREISAVCTHPSFLRRGYARQLVTQLMQEIQQDGETPFLHVFGENTGAFTLYKSLGFKLRTDLQVSIVKRR